MHIISRKALRKFAAKHTDAKEPLEDWYRVASRAKWQNISEVRVSYPHADAVGICTVFNIKGNDYRLITWVAYSSQRIFIRHVLTHAEYDREGWKRDCSSKS